jgi:UDP-N-acetylmuramate dehydrogenase
MIIKHDFCLKPFNTFGVEVMARNLCIVNSVSTLQELFKAGMLKDQVTVIGKGSNVVLTDHIEGIVLLNQIWGKEIIEETDSYVILKVNSGEFWPSLVEFAVENGWGGIENLTDIPGRVGAAPIQNIGAYGVELSDVIESVEAFCYRTGELETYSNNQCKFGYRTSRFKTFCKNKCFITSITIKLSKEPVLNLTYKPLADALKGIENATISDVSKAVAEIRASKLPNPDKLNNAGSFFKNPIINMEKFHDIKLAYSKVPNYPQKNMTYKIPAAWLIEKCGWKGKRVGNIGVHRDQALVIVKYDSATGKEIVDLANEIKDSVMLKFGINLEFEVNVI